MATKNKRGEWSNTDTRLFLSVWADNFDDLRRNKRHKVVFTKMKEQLDELGVKKTELEVQTKIKNMTKRYRQEKKKVGPSGGSPSDWPFYAEVHSLLGPLPCNDDSLIDEGSAARTIRISESSSSSTEVEETPANLSPEVHSPGDTSSGDSSTVQNGSTTNESRTGATRRGKKRSAVEIQSEMLEQAKIANSNSKIYEEEMIKLQKQSNDIALQQVSLTRELIEIMRNTN